MLITTSYLFAMPLSVLNKFAPFFKSSLFGSNNKDSRLSSHGHLHITSPRSFPLSLSASFRGRPVLSRTIPPSPSLSISNTPSGSLPLSSPFSNTLPSTFLPVWKDLIGVDCILDALTPAHSLSSGSTSTSGSTSRVSCSTEEVYYDASEFFSHPPRWTFFLLFWSLQIGFSVWWVYIPELVSLTPLYSLSPEWVSCVQDLISLTSYCRETNYSPHAIEVELSNTVIDLLKIGDSNTFDPLGQHLTERKTLAFLLGSCILSGLIVGQSLGLGVPF